MAINLTEQAATAVKEYMQAQEIGEDEQVFLRIGVAGGGCSGFNYRLEFDKAYDETKDDKFKCHGVEVVIDRKSALYLDGTTLDYQQSLYKSGFTFENPNAVKTCGCGSSFQA